MTEIYNVQGCSGGFFMFKDSMYVKVRGSNVRYFSDSISQRVELEKNILATEGDLILGRVLNNNGSFRSMENQFGRQTKINKDDIVITVLGNRHSGTSEFGGIQNPLLLDDDIELDLLSDGGIVGIGDCVPEKRLTQYFTKIQPLGLLKHQKKILNVENLSPKVAEIQPQDFPPIILTSGTSSGAGKTTTTLAIVKALQSYNFRVAAVKLAGTGRLGDVMIMQDAGADFCTDFPNYGLISSYTSPKKVLKALTQLISHTATQNVDIIVGELGGDIIEGCVREIITWKEIQDKIISIIHVSEDVLSILGSQRIYRDLNIDKPILYTLPKGRNKVASRNRLSEFSITPFDPFCSSEINQAIKSLISNHSDFSKKCKP